MFPDFPTEKGRKHLIELIDVKKKGMGAGILFLIQLENVNHFLQMMIWTISLEKLLDLQIKLMWIFSHIIVM